VDVEIRYFDGGQRKAVDGWKPKDLETPEATPAPKTLSEIRSIVKEKGAIQASTQTGDFPQIETPKDYYKQGTFIDTKMIQTLRLAM